jgi:hypothetical protein
VRTDVGQEDAHLAVLQLAGDPAVLDAHPDRVGPLLEDAGLIDHQHAGGVAQFLAHVGLQVVAHGIGVPFGAVEQVLEAVRGGVSGVFGQLPPILALEGAEQAGEVRAQMSPCFAAGEVATQAGEDGVQGSGPPGRVGRRRIREGAARSAGSHVRAPRA